MDKNEEDAHANPVKMEKKSKKSKNKTKEVDGGVPKKEGHKHKEKKRKYESNEDGDEDRRDKGNLEDDCGLQKKDKKKRKRDSSEDNHPTEKTQIKENEQTRDNELAVEKDCDPKPRKEKKRKHKHRSHESEPENDDNEEDCQEDMLEKAEKKKKKKKKTDDKSSDAEMNGITTDESGDKGKKKGKSVKKSSDAEMNVDTEMNVTTDESGNKGKKKGKSVKKNSEKRKSKDKEKTTKSVENNTEKPKPKAKGKPKKVSFSGQVEVFPYSDTETEKQKTKGDGLVRGKRFTPEEDEIVKEAVLNYIEVNNLGEDGLKMVLNCSSHRGMKKCWQDIATCIPYRPSSAVYYRAHILFERSETRSWTPEEIETLRELHEKEGNKWKKMAEEMGKHRFHVKDAWRRIKLKDRKSGRWNQEEYQNLYDLVNLDLQMKVSSEVKQSKHGMLRDNIPWTAISEKLSTRSDATCCIKWYNQLTSSLVAEKKWSDADDYRLIGALYELDAACMEDVDWDNILEHRPGEVCKKRWNQMVCHIGHHGSKPFSEQVDTLAKRYCPDLAETREAWDNKPVV